MGYKERAVIEPQELQEYYIPRENDDSCGLVPRAWHQL